VKYTTGKRKKVGRVYTELFFWGGRSFKRVPAAIQKDRCDNIQRREFLSSTVTRRKKGKKGKIKKNNADTTWDWKMFEGSLSNGNELKSSKRTHGERRGKRKNEIKELVMYNTLCVRTRRGLQVLHSQTATKLTDFSGRFCVLETSFRKKGPFFCC